MGPMVSPTLLILAAGSGSRYGGQKLVEPIGYDGEKIMDYSIFDARHAGFGKIVLVIRRDMEKYVKERVAERFGKHLAVEYAYQEIADLPSSFRTPPGRTKPWGTTQAILTASSLIHEPFAVINANDFYGAQSYHALAHHLLSGTTDYAMVAFVLRNTLSDYGAVARGVCRVSDCGFLEDILELKNVERDGGHASNTDADGQETTLTGNELVSMNMWGFTPHVFGQLRESFQRFLEQNGTDLEAECLIPNTMNEMIHAGQARVKALRCGDSWFGVTYREDHPRAVESIRQLIKCGYYPKKLW
jgi:dTDP-glucose pyrophosphorylase